MARDEIRTRWHDWVSLYRAGKVLVPSQRGVLEHKSLVPGMRKDGLDAVADGLETLPHYFISTECMQFVDSEALTTSINALQRAGIEALQHQHCVVEFERAVSDGGNHRTRFIVTVSRRDFPIMAAEHCYHPYICRVFMLYQPDYAYLESMGRAKRLLGKERPKEWAVAPASSYLIRCIPRGFVDVSGKAVEDDGFHFMTMPAPWIDGNPRVDESRAEDEMRHAAGTAVRCLLGLMRTRGIEQAPVSAPKLNKARAAQRKPSIPDHTVVRLGFYMDRSGARRSYDPTSRVPQVMHYRSAHTKRVWYGPRHDPKCREQFIEGYVVNYVDGAEKPGPRPKVVRAPKLSSGEVGS